MRNIRPAEQENILDDILVEKREGRRRNIRAWASVVIALIQLIYLIFFCVNPAGIFRGRNARIEVSFIFMIIFIGYVFILYSFRSNGKENRS